MKAFLLSSILAISFATPAQAVTVEEAQQAYNQRDFTQPGVKSALSAAESYSELAQAEQNTLVKAKHLIAQSEALYFVAYASTSKDDKLKYHYAGVEAADAALKIFGITDVQKADLARLKALPADQKALVGEGLYFRGINLGQWGNTKGVVESLSRWPELRDNMNLIVNLGLKEIHEYGAYRTLGRAYFKIPGLLGGSTKKALKYLSEAVNNSKVEGEIYSVNGINNLFYAEILKEEGKSADAKDLLNKFIAADANTLHSGLVPENRQAQKEAQALLKSW